MKRFAILLGNEHYEEFLPTDFCHNDVNLIYDTLVNCCDYAEQDVLKRELEPKKSHTPKKILDDIKNLVKKAKPGDTVLFYYAGHGAYIDGESYLILPDSSIKSISKTALPLRDVSNVLRNKHQINIRIFDSCHSGEDVRDGNILVLNQAQFTRNILEGSHEGWITLAACKHDEYSHSDPTKKHGIFTYHLCETIKAFSDNEPILPEILKVKVCEKVHEWCQENNRRQTPTYNSAISGNITIASRVIVKVEEKKDKIETPEEISLRKEKEEKLLTSRLAKIRKYKSIGNQEHCTNLKKLLENLMEIVKSKLDSLQLPGLSMKINSPIEADKIEVEIKKMIASEMRKHQIRPLHKICIEYEYEKIEDFDDPFLSIYKDLLPAYKDLLPAKRRKIIDTHYRIEQKSDFPESFFDVCSNSDGYSPGCRMYFYIVPLMIKACILIGYIIDYGEGPKNDEYAEKIFSPIIIDLDNPEKKDITGSITSLIDQFYDQYLEIVKKRISYLEWEISLE